MCWKEIGNVFEPTADVYIGSDICLKCHKAELTKYPVMHGPVAAVECLRCHTPHESNSPALLGSTSPRICVQCHVPELLSPKPVEHLDLKRDCLECHVAHGGLKHMLLRATPTTQPTTQPTTRPAPGNRDVAAIDLPTGGRP